MSYFRKPATLVTFALVISGIFSTVSVLTATAQADNKRIIQMFVVAYNAAIKSGDLTSVEVLLSPDYTDLDAPQGVNGWDYFKQTFMQIKSRFPDGQIIIKDMVAENDKVVLFSLFTARNSCALSCLSNSGKLVSVKQMKIFTLKDGKISSVQNVSDAGAFYHQLGFIIAPRHQVVPTPIASTALPDVESSDCTGQ